MSEHLPEQVGVRLSKLERIRASGVDPYPVRVPRSTTLAALRDRYRDLAPGAASGEQASVTGRVIRLRDNGRLVFATLAEGATELQVMLGYDQLGEQLSRWKSQVDLGDHLSVTGEVISSRRGELSVRATSWQFAAKALQPLPDKYRGLTDPETRIRRRYLDMIVNSETRAAVAARATVLSRLRAVLAEHGYLEVETPVLQPVHGGATARPFKTHLNAFALDVYLRIALELYLKRLVVGGFERVYEIGRIFRNEGVDATHNPEFTMLEAYEAYGDYLTMAALTRELIREAAAALGVTSVRTRSGDVVDLGGEWARIGLYESVSEAVGAHITPDTDLATLRATADRFDIALKPDRLAGEIVVDLFENLVEHRLLAPTFVLDYPAAARPLAKPSPQDPRVTESWDLIIAGVEIAVAFSELNDPIEQRRRLTEQSLRAAGGDPEAMALDEDFLLALEYGMPPTGGLGLGVDRLLLLLLGSNIREVIAFPTTRPGS
ncbi:MAG: lysine--tRNA ligase [Mycobacteriales bacterium]